MLTIFYGLYLRKGFLVLAKQQGIIENHVQQAPSASGQLLQQPYIPGQTSEEPDELKPWIDAHMRMVQAHLSIHIGQETAIGLLTKGPREAPIESCGSREWRASERAETTTYKLPIKMFAYNSTAQISQKINPSSSKII